LAAGRCLPTTSADLTIAELALTVSLAVVLAVVLLAL
jgi:hypothetical protein